MEESKCPSLEESYGVKTELSELAYLMILSLLQTKQNIKKKNGYWMGRPSSNVWGYKATRNELNVSTRVILKITWDLGENERNREKP